MSALRAIHAVYANWCPHCVPLTVDAIKAAAEELNVPNVLHDIDTDDVDTADEMVRKYGDLTPDYLIPQVFLEFENGVIRHVLTGDPRGLAFTRRALDDLFKGQLFVELKRSRSETGFATAAGD